MFHDTLNSHEGTENNWYFWSEAEPVIPDAEDRMWQKGLLAGWFESTNFVWHTYILCISACTLHWEAARNTEGFTNNLHSFILLSHHVESPTWRTRRMYLRQTKEGLSITKRNLRMWCNTRMSKIQNHCIVWLYKLYNQKCPSKQPPDAFCLKPKVNPKSDDCWYDGKGTIF